MIEEPAQTRRGQEQTAVRPVIGLVYLSNPILELKLFKIYYNV